MFAVEVYAAVPHFVFIEGNNRREAARVFKLSRDQNPVLLRKVRYYENRALKALSRAGGRSSTPCARGDAGDSLARRGVGRAVRDRRGTRRADGRRARSKD